MDALIFDYDGVVVDSEPVHMEGFARVVKPMGIEFTKGEYCENYLGFDDYVGFAAILTNHGHHFDQELINRMVAEKTAILKEALAGAIDDSLKSENLNRFTEMAAKTKEKFSWSALINVIMSKGPA